MRKNCLGYPVEIVDGVFSEENDVLATLLREVTGVDRPRVMLVTDQNVVIHSDGLGMRIGRWMQAMGVELAGPPLLITGGERVKCDEMKTGLEILKTALAMKVGRGDAVLIVGGGSIMDVAGWAMTQVRGGVPAVRMPTTPLAMLDAAFSSYAAMDATGVKDAFRVPCVPRGVVIDPSFADTVLEGVWRAGFAAAMRLAVVSDAALVKLLVKLAPAYRKRDAAALREIIEATLAVRMKKKDTEFALWATHRLESMSGYRLPYGYAVAMGIALSAAYAVDRGTLQEEDRRAICDALLSSGAMEGANHNQRLLERDDLLLQGLEAWRLVNGSDAVVIPAGIGKGKIEETPDRDTMKRAINLLK